MIKKIMVPLDGSEFAEAVLPYVTEFADRMGSEVLLFTAVGPVATWDAAASMIRWDREQAAAQEYLDGKRSLLAAAGRTVRATVVLGDAAESILRVAQTEKIDLIALTTHGRSGITRWLFGSIATKLVQASDLPLLVIRPREGAPPPAPAIKKVLVPLDGSDVAQSILPFVEELAKTLGARLVLFHAIAPITAYPGFETTQPAALGQVLEEMQEHARQMLARAVEELKGRGLAAEAAVTIDLAVDGIIAAAQELKVDLIALGTHGRSGLGRAVMGSVADGVLRRSAVPCLLVHPRETPKT
ncbi:MAG: universal stress protein [Dehalococcoidia bacterium]|nr:universal stress protein [Dehalococcoidia bacterium]